MKKLFFGWENFKWLCRELLAMFSNTNSYFSKKRFESSLAFFAAMSIVMYHVWYSRETITNSEVLADATLLFVIAGYTVKQIQTEKVDAIKKPTTDAIKDKPIIVGAPKDKKEDFSKDEDAV